MARAQLIAYVSPSSPQQEEAFNQWYDEVHIPQVVERIPGVVGGNRFRLATAQLVSAAELPARRYLAVYELDTDDLQSLANRLAEALGDGTLDITDAIDMTDQAPVLHFYEPV
ncbi:hypothetical protein BJF85_06985 [Saccharomonospora sp. CUA-673]|uniref:DUF4286 family protein n=1 Tax=Saccharomonospora sp. CUA-673 TaxID=1904969 RepID=UPI00095E3175|nr:DUF4286 family protein [Saccharomonospora sp. CUA-673]OLT40052.1 hypothetical protein BJF85_06985 [Saccharomonospora sp. CUA-673]